MALNKFYTITETILLCIAVFIVILITINQVKFNNIYEQNQYIGKVNDCMIMYNNIYNGQSGVYPSCHCARDVLKEKVLVNETYDTLKSWVNRNCNGID